MALALIFEKFVYTKKLEKKQAKMKYHRKRHSKPSQKSSFKRKWEEMNNEDGITSHSMTSPNDSVTDKKCQTTAVLQDHLEDNPWCAHGPTVLFERISSMGKDDKRTQFYACSAYRDRKDCSAHFKADDVHPSHISQEKKLKWKHVIMEDRNTIPHSRLNESVYYCRQCCQLVEISSDGLHKGHEISKIEEKSLEQPTLEGLLESKSSAKKEAQYHFSVESLDVLVNEFILKQKGISRILCIGAPSIHEKILSLYTEKLDRNPKSMLLDIDFRLRSFYNSVQRTSDTFCHYNMFNHFFFRVSEQNNYLDFLKDAKGEILIVTDPPFGGKCELIGRTLKCIQKDVINLSGGHDQIHTMWIFPYYMERFIQQEIPSIKMSDYQVCYSSNGTSSYKDGLEIGKQGARKV